MAQLALSKKKEIKKKHFLNSCHFFTKLLTVEIKPADKCLYRKSQLIQTEGYRNN